MDLCVLIIANVEESQWDETWEQAQRSGNKEPALIHTQHHFLIYLDYLFGYLFGTSTLVSGQIVGTLLNRLWS